MNNAIEVENLGKSFKAFKALDGVSFTARKGEVVGLLGPNGAGKTTTVKILSTLLAPDQGLAKINGFDITQNPNQVRASIGLTGQYAAVDEYLSARENLEMIGQLYRLGREKAKKLSGELLERFDLVESGSKIVKTFSGGQRRRIDLAMSLIASPPVLFLDEPTTGLDPRSRLTMWKIIKELAATDVTVLLTTQYMEEADYLSDSIVVIDHGKVIAKGTPDELKNQIGSERLEMVIDKQSDFDKAAQVLRDKSAQVNADERKISVATGGTVAEIKRTLDTLQNHNIEIESLSLHKPTLDDVFLQLTGHETNQNNT